MDDSKLGLVDASAFRFALVQVERLELIRIASNLVFILHGMAVHRLGEYEMVLGDPRPLSETEEWKVAEMEWPMKNAPYKLSEFQGSVRADPAFPFQTLKFATLLTVETLVESEPSINLEISDSDTEDEIELSPLPPRTASLLEASSSHETTFTHSHYPSMPTSSSQQARSPPTSSKPPPLPSEHPSVSYSGENSYEMDAEGTMQNLASSASQKSQRLQSMNVHREAASDDFLTQVPVNDSSEYSETSVNLSMGFHTAMPLPSLGLSQHHTTSPVASQHSHALPPPSILFEDAEIAQNDPSHVSAALPLSPFSDSSISKDDEPEASSDSELEVSVEKNYKKPISRMVFFGGLEESEEEEEEENVDPPSDSDHEPTSSIRSPADFASRFSSKRNRVDAEDPRKRYQDERDFLDSDSDEGAPPPKRSTPASHRR